MKIYVLDAFHLSGVEYGRKSRRRSFAGTTQELRIGMKMPTD